MFTCGAKPPTRQPCLIDFFFFNDTATTEIYTLSLHDALPISRGRPDAPRSLPVARCLRGGRADRRRRGRRGGRLRARGGRDRKSTRLNSSHLVISYALFCLKKKTNTKYIVHRTSTRRTQVLQP